MAKYTDRNYSFDVVPKEHKDKPSSPAVMKVRERKTDSAMSFSDIERRWSRKGFYVVPGTGTFNGWNKE